jgi:hypothetical protein
MAGVWKVFQLGPLEHARKYFLPFSDTFLPVWPLWLIELTDERTRGLKSILTS